MQDFGPRFQIVRCIGTGGMGVVYEAVDHHRGTRVALKAMQSLDAIALYRFKREFRALSDIAHPNLVTLHDLFSEGDRVFLTMELVHGVDLLRYVGGADGVFAPTLPAVAADGAEPRSTRPQVASAISAEGAVRLRSAMQQLTEGLAHLHAAGKLHRDVKPTNILVTDEGRLVLLDFGLVTELAPTRDSERTFGQSVAGTPEYMSPEQASGGELGPASDWYSAGVVLYEALTGKLPFDGPPLRILMDKQIQAAPSPAALSPGAPPDLVELCVRLLDRDPERRPREANILGALSGGALGRPLATRRSRSTLETPFVGREAHVEEMLDAFEASKGGAPVCVRVHGASGMGKTILVRRVLDRITLANPSAVVLAGRCYERDLMPYRGLDSVVDALSRWLMKLPPAELAAVMPRDIQMLARVFPILRQVEGKVEGRRRAVENPDPQHVRRRAFNALREVLTRIADRRPLVLWTDDLQWADADGAVLLGDLLRPPDAPSILVIASYRSEDTVSSEALAALRASLAMHEPRVDTREIAVGPLSPEDALGLARGLLGGHDPGDDAQAALIAAEACGIPFFVDELVRHVQSGTAHRPGTTSAVSLDDVIVERVATLPDDARLLLEVIAVAARPLELGIALAAADVAPSPAHAALAMLRTAHLVRAAAVRGRESVTTYHDRVREAVAGSLDAAERADRHRRIALALERTGDADPEALCNHFDAAGEPALAATHALIAGDRAAVALAFAHAAELYERALAMRVWDPSDLRAIRWKLGDALASNGKGAEAAIRYVAAAEGAPAADALELRRRAAEELLRSGHIEQGLDAMRDVLATVEMRMPRTAIEGILVMIALSIVLLVRGLRFRERDASVTSRKELTRIDVCWSCAAGLSVVDNVRARAFHKRNLLLSLRAGEPSRVHRALSPEITVVAIGGSKAARRTARVSALAQALAERDGRPYALGLNKLARGTAAFLEGRWRDALTLMDDSETMLREQCTGAAFEVANAQIWAMWSLFFLGELRQLSERVPVLINEAHERGDLFLMTNLRIGRTNTVWLAADAPERADEEVADAMRRWSQLAVHNQHFYSLMARTMSALYRGDGQRAVAMMDAEIPAVRRTFLFRVQTCRIEARHFYAQALLASAAETPARAPGLARRAARIAKKISGEGVAWGTALACLIRAGCASVCGNPSRAVACLTEATAQFDATGMQLWAAGTRRRHGEIIGGDEGASLLAASDAFMTAQQIRNPARMTAMLAPGFPRR